MEITFWEFALIAIAVILAVLIVFTVPYVIHCFVMAIIEDLKGSDSEFKVFLGIATEMLYYGAIILLGLFCLYFILFCLF